MFSQPLIDAIAEAESLVAEAPHIETEADLLEGLQYLAGCISGCIHLAFDYDRDYPSCSRAPGRSPRWAWTTRTPCTSAPGWPPGTSTSCGADAGRPPI
ncbi:hypothetical protein MINS_43210 [Mycolicibacterium insubricum]|nr:hypothetical protein MINS_43210 [Mycolicibacterium insubricum]